MHCFVNLIFEGKLNFNFKNDVDSIEYAKYISSNMQVYAVEDVLFAGYYQTKFDSEAIEQLLEHLTPEKMKLKVISKKYQGQTDQIEKWHGTEYREESLKTETLTILNNCGLNKAFKMPQKNQFIPSDLSLIHRVKHFQHPQRINSSLTADLWYKEDSRFFLPKVYLKYRIR